MKSNGRKDSGKSVKRNGVPAPVPVKNNALGATPIPGETSIKELFNRPGKVKGDEGTLEGKRPPAPYLESRRRGLPGKSAQDHITKEFWMDIYAEVSAYKYPSFMHRLEGKVAEHEAIQQLYNVCKILLTKAERDVAVKTRLQRRNRREEIKVYSPEEKVY